MSKTHKLISGKAYWHIIRDVTWCWEYLTKDFDSISWEIEFFFSNGPNNVWGIQRFLWWSCETKLPNQACLLVSKCKSIILKVTDRQKCLFLVKACVSFKMSKAHKLIPGKMYCHIIRDVTWCLEYLTKDFDSISREIEFFQMNQRMKGTVRDFFNDVVRQLWPDVKFFWLNHTFG